MSQDDHPTTLEGSQMHGPRLARAVDAFQDLSQNPLEAQAATESVSTTSSPTPLLSSDDQQTHE